ncbi:dipeptidase [uncultured Pontibacter sp.]|uniref:dipeptidase n=1 Tax=uncultured Pontibacter sp. TaxID=453356 RepID=UPI002619AC91|nr:dipeptidase [uncultured Pontibacter sp.]
MTFNFDISVLRKSALTLVLSSAAVVGFAQSQDYKRVHEKAILVDTHNDVLISILEGMDISKDLRGKTHSDLARFKQGGVDVQYFSVWSDEKGDHKFARLQIDTLKAVIARNPEQMVLATSHKEIMAAVEQGKMASLIGVEGGHMIDNDLKKLDALYNLGARYMTLTWNNSIPWASSAADETSGKMPKSKKGLKGIGKQVVKRMNELGMMVDLSHVGEKTFWDVMAITKKPVLVSHSCVHKLNPVPRNLKDDQIKAIAKNGGVIQLNFYSGFLDPEFDKRFKTFNQNHEAELDSLVKLGWSSSNISELMRQKYTQEFEQVRPPLSILFDHLDHIVELVGVDYVGMGSDFDGISSTPQQLDGVDDYPIVTKELLARGYSVEDINKILGGNVLRVVQANEKK